MPYDETLAARVRTMLAGSDGYGERKMFGGIAFMLHGNMCCGIVRDELMVRVGAERYEAALARKHARPMDFNGRPMRGMVYVAPEGVRRGAQLKAWLDLATAYARSLPPKEKARRPAR